MRGINPETGEAYPRKRPVDWTAVRAMLRYRQDDRELVCKGFKRVKAFSALEWESPELSHRIVDVRITRDGMGLYVKLQSIRPVPDVMVTSQAKRGKGV